MWREGKGKGHLLLFFSTFRGFTSRVVVSVVRVVSQLSHSWVYQPGNGSPIAVMHGGHKSSLVLAVAALPSSFSIATILLLLYVGT